MTATTRESAPTVIDSGGVRLAGTEIGGDLTVGFVRLPQGTDLGPALAGLPGGLCQCPHWGWAPGHAPIALEYSEYVDFSPTAELAPVLAPLTGVR